MEINLGDNIRRLRREAGFTQEQLAEALGVTAGAVYKWESKTSMPEIRLLVEMARLFETSVDVLLGYSWESGSMGQAAEKIRVYRNERNFDAGLRYAEGALQKYPNSFEVVFQSANLYFMSMVVLRGKSARRAIELYRRSIELIDQNTDESVGVITIQNSIASCYCYLGRMDKAIEILQKNNVGGLNDAKIGLFMSQDPGRAEEALKYLSDALHNYYARIFEICIGYANAYGILEELDKIEALMLWLLDVSKGLRDPSVVNFMDKTNVRIHTILAEVRFLKGDQQGAYDWLLTAKNTAQRFDAAPEFRTHVGLKFYHSDMDAVSIDDMGETAMSMIENYINVDTTAANLRPIWEEIKNNA